MRAKVQRPFRVIKRQFGHVKVRYRGLKKYSAQLVTLFALSNLWMVRGILMGTKGLSGSENQVKVHQGQEGGTTRAKNDATLKVCT